MDRLISRSETLLQALAVVLANPSVVILLLAETSPVTAYSTNSYQGCEMGALLTSTNSR